MKWYQITDEPLQIFGLAVKEKDSFFRLPLDVVDNINEGTKTLGRHSAGGRVRFRTDSKTLTVRHAVQEVNLSGAVMSILAKSGADIYVDGIFRGNRPSDCGASVLFEKSVDKDATMQDIDIYLPTYNRTLRMEIGVDDDARVEAPRPYAIPDPIVFYGSSITQGAAASHPGVNYVAATARQLNADFINLGFSGNARGEENMARYIAGLKMSAFVLDYDHNAPTAEHLRATHKPFFDIIRAAQPDLPILILSRPDFYPECKAADSAERRDIVKATYEQAIAGGDRHVAFIDGEHIFPADEWNECTADTCHPNDLGFHYMTLAAVPALKRLLGLN